MKPYSRNDGTIQVRNRSKYGSVPKKTRRTGFKVANPTNFWGTIAVPLTLIKKRFKKAVGLSKHNFEQFGIDKL